MKHLELDLEKKCRQYARERGWVMAKLEKNGHKGIPDDMLISPQGRVILVELKKNNKAFIRPEQVHWKSRFPALIYFIDNYADFQALLTAIE